MAVDTDVISFTPEVQQNAVLCDPTVSMPSVANTTTASLTPTNTSSSFPTIRKSATEAVASAMSLRTGGSYSNETSHQNKGRMVDMQNMLSGETLTPYAQTSGEYTPREGKSIGRVYDSTVNRGMPHGVSRSPDESLSRRMSDTDSPRRRMCDSPRRRMPDTDSPRRRMPDTDSPRRRMIDTDSPRRRMNDDKQTLNHVRTAHKISSFF